MNEINNYNNEINNEQNVRSIIASNLTKYRKNLGLTQLELAEKLNYSDKTLSKWERGESIPDIVTLVKKVLLLHLFEKKTRNRQLDAKSFVLTYYR